MVTAPTFESVESIGFYRIRPAIYTMDLQIFAPPQWPRGESMPGILRVVRNFRRSRQLRQSDFRPNWFDSEHALPHSMRISDPAPGGKGGCSLLRSDSGRRVEYIPAVVDFPYLVPIGNYLPILS